MELRTWVIKLELTRMHSSRMRTTRSLTISCSICHAHPPAMHAPFHACHPPATHAPLPCTSPCHAWCPCHTHPCHACPPATHAPPATYAPCHTHPPPCMPPLPCMPPALYAPLPCIPPPVVRILYTRFWKYYLAPTLLRAVIKYDYIRSLWLTSSYIRP